MVELQMEIQLRVSRGDGIVVKPGKGALDLGIWEAFTPNNGYDSFTLYTLASSKSRIPLF